MNQTESQSSTSVRGTCSVSNAISIDGKRVGYMYRDPSFDFPHSGWHFLSGRESQAYLRNPQNVSVVELNEFVAKQPEVIPYLRCPPETALKRKKNGSFEEIED